MKLLGSILMVLFFSNAIGMQKKDPFFEKQFKMAQLMHPQIAKAHRKNDNLSFFWGGMAAISVGCALASYMGYERCSKISLKGYMLAIGCSGLFCIRDKRTANIYRQQLVEVALQITFVQVCTAQVIGIEAWAALQRL